MSPRPAPPQSAPALARIHWEESRRVGLTRARVVQAAIELADAHGLDAVTMRRVAEGLGVVPMALYKHVGDKEDLVDGMVDAVIEEFPPTPVTTDWQRAVATVVGGARTVVTAHPWARRALETRTVRTPVVLGYMERISQCFLTAGFTPDQTHHVMHLLGSRIWGFSPELFTAPAAGEARPVRKSDPRRSAPDPADYPGILAIAAEAHARRPGATGCDEDFEFGFALEVLLDGIARLREAGFESPRSSG